MTDFRQLPSVDRLLRAVGERLNGHGLPHELVVQAVRDALNTARAAIAAQQVAPSIDILAGQVAAQLDQLMRPSLRPVINATGVIIQTNLGRAPLSEAALAAMATIGGGYSNLEYDLDAGERGSRYTHLGTLLCRLTGAEAALAVNNNAAAIYLALSALAREREVLISRGQAVEIGGGFRIPDVLRASGATLVEVGTTNRTYARDYADAITERTALLMRIHTSNFKLVGFVHETRLSELAEVGHAAGVPVLDDLGSGTLLSTAPYGLAAEPTVGESVAAGADLVTFSGDKLLGGPQAGLIVGRKTLVDQLKRHPLARALRVDKTTLAGLEATLLSYLRGRAIYEIPVWQMIAASLEGLQTRAEALIAQLGAAGITAETIACQSAIGGGSLPGETLPSIAVGLVAPQSRLEQATTALRHGDPPVVARIADGRLLFDLRTVLPVQDAALGEAIHKAL